MRTQLVSVTDPLTSSQQQAMALLKQRGQLTVGQKLDFFVSDEAKRRGLRRTDVLRSVAIGLQKRGLVILTRPDRRGPMVMTLADSKGGHHA